nr:MAG TPA: hypothetical protein [Caudoviricetes sp.]
MKYGVKPYIIRSIKNRKTPQRPNGPERNRK